MSWHKFLGSPLICIIAIISSQAQGNEEFMNLKQNQVIADFRVDNLYENEPGKAMGARFHHIPSGFVLDLLRIQSVPQAFMWVNSFPPSDMGEPHTCEHLMLGKGARGRYVASLEEMSLGNSSAFTAQLQTCYHFHTSAGKDAFFQLMEAKLEALIHPNFSDEEIRREVCHIGYTIDPVDSSLRLEEKGTVYNEMQTTYERPWGNLGRAMDRALYGPNHPLSNESGGFPDSIRNMVPEDMRNFIAKNYHISNMGMVVSIADDIDIDECLRRISEILKSVEPDAKPGIDPARADELLPPPQPAAPGRIQIVGFPSNNEKEPGLLIYAWPPVLKLDGNEEYLLELFMSNLASGETSNLYRKFIDSQTRVIDIGANAVFEWVSSEKGNPVYVGFSNIRRESIREAELDTIRELVLREIENIVKLPDNSPELLAFNERAKSRIIGRRRDIRNFLSQPPGFGYRGTGSRWLDHLKRLQKCDGFIRNLTLENELQFAEQQLATGKNFWKEYVAQWKLLDIKPSGFAARPDCDMPVRAEQAKTERINSFVQNLMKTYSVSDRKRAIGLFQTEYDIKTAEIDSTANTIAMPKFINDPPLTLDDQLHYEVKHLPGNGQFVASTFENMSGATVGLAFGIDVIPESLLFYSAVIPTLMTEVGVIKGRPYSYDEMKETLRREILDLRAYYSVNYRTERAELVVRASGSDSAESQKALEWLDAILFGSYWTRENLPRLRDAIDLTLSDLRNTTRGPEESWVDDPANAYWKQRNPVILYTNSFLTQSHAFHRLRWLLMDAGSQSSADEFAGFMAEMSAYGKQADRDDLVQLLAIMGGDQTPPKTTTLEMRELTGRMGTLSSDAMRMVGEAVEDIKLLLAEIPDISLETDWSYLCEQMVADVRVPADDVLRNLNHVMTLIRHSDNVRGFVIGNTANQTGLQPEIDAIISRLDKAPSIRQSYDDKPVIVSRLKERLPQTDRPIFVGLVNSNTRSGVFLNSAPCASFEDQDPEILLNFLAARLYGGGGAHSMFMKTWSAGLAYSNGLRSNEFTGRLNYYAERCPDLAQTMEFVVSELRNAPYDPSLAEYAVAQAFAMYRSGSRYEVRGEGMASDLADGLTPDVVRNFRRKILELRQDPHLYDKLRNRMENIYGRVLPGYGPRADSLDDAVYFIIGPEKLFQTYEEYLHSVEGPATLYRLFPRDFWIPRPFSPDEKNSGHKINP